MPVGQNELVSADIVEKFFQATDHFVNQKNQLIVMLILTDLMVVEEKREL